MTFEKRPSHLLLAFGLGMSVAASHGIGRLGYALLLPAMREDMNWTFTLASWMNTANALGYLLGAITGYLLLRHFETARLFVVGLLLVVITVSLTGLSNNFLWLFSMRLLTGLGTAWSFSCGGALVTHWYAGDDRLRGYATGVFFGCAGIGMVLTAILVPELLHAVGNRAWPQSWILLGAVCALLSIFPVILASHKRGNVSVSKSSLHFSWRGTNAEILAYLLFAIAHTSHLFFVFAWVRSQDVHWRLGSFMWMVIGGAIFASPFIWQRALNSWRATRILSACSFVTFIGSAIPLVALNVPSVLLSAALVGSAAFIAPSAMAVLARQHLPQAAWSSGLMVYTIIFALGQAIGSWASGWTSDTYSLRTTLIWGALGLLASSVIALLGPNLAVRRSTNTKPSDKTT